MPMLTRIYPTVYPVRSHRLLPRTHTANYFKHFSSVSHPLRLAPIIGG